MTYSRKKPKHGLIDSQKRETYLDKHIREKKKIPCSAKYSKIRNWAKNRVGKFSKTKRVTIMQEIITKFKKTPGPATYKTQARRKPVNKSQSRVTKTGLMGEIEYLAKSTPGIGKYDLNKSYTCIEKHSVEYKFGKVKEVARPKSRGPGPSDYQVEKSIHRT